MNGYQGRMLIVDLTEGKILTENFDEQFARKYIGGVGFGTRLLYDRLAPHLDPFCRETISFLQQARFLQSIL